MRHKTYIAAYIACPRRDLICPSRRLGGNPGLLVRRVLSLLGALLVLQGCDTLQLTKPTVVNSRDEAAAVLVSVTTVAEWEQIADAVQPNFALTSDSALQQVAPVTSRIQEQTLSAFGLGVGIGLPQSSSQSTNSSGASSSLTSTTSGGAATGSGASTTTSSSTSTDTRQPGAAPAPATGIPAGGQLPGAPSVAGDVGLDPILKYQAALALYQTVQLMNKQVRYVASIGCFVPYVIQLKLAVVPYRRHLPYDVHARVAFFSDINAHKASADGAKKGSDDVPLKHPAASIAASIETIKPEGAAPPQPTLLAPLGAPVQGECRNSGDLPVVLPLLVTDDIERSLKSRAVETAKQISFALSAMVHGVGANAGLNSVNQQLASIMGQDVNSRLTVTRQSDNTLYVRIGASNEATAGVALIGQTYDVSLLLLVPQSYFDNNASPLIQMHTFPEFRNALDGTVLRSRAVSTLVAQGSSAMQDMLLGDALVAWNEADESKKEAVVRKLVSPILRNSWDDYETAVESVVFTSKKLGKEVRLDIRPPNRRALWTRLSVLIADTPVKTTFFELHRPLAVRIRDQVALLLDDGKEKAQIQLRDADGVTSKALGASLVMVAAKDGTKYPFPAQSIAYDETTGILTLVFPSPAKWGLGDADIAKSHLQLTQRCSAQSLCPQFAVPARFALLRAPSDSSAPDNTPKFNLIANVRQIIATNAAGTVSVSIDKLKEDAALVTVSNKNQVTVTRDSAILFRLQNVRAGMVVNIAAEGKKDGRLTGKKSLDFFVVSN